ncbi:hypothetical protein D3C78_1000910 [compost metagenome]
MDALREAADAGGPGLHHHPGDAFEQGGGEHHIGLLAGDVEQAKAQDAQQQFEQGADQQADGQHPQGGERLVGYHAVVGLHDEQRHHQAEQVDQQAGEQGVGVQPARQLEGVAKPRLDAGDQRRAQLLQLVARAGKQCLAGVFAGQLLALHPLFATGRFAGQDQRAALFVPATQHGTAPVLEQQQYRQVER